MNPIVANNKPAKVALIECEEYYICACGRSKDQSFCDGSHAGTNFKPKSFIAEENGDAYLCQCKHSANFPFAMAVINSSMMLLLEKKALGF